MIIIIVMVLQHDRTMYRWRNQNVSKKGEGSDRLT